MSSARLSPNWRALRGDGALRRGENPRPLADFRSRQRANGAVDQSRFDCDFRRPTAIRNNRRLRLVFASRHEWLGIENAAAIDRKMLGGSPQKNAAAGLGCAVLEDAFLKSPPAIRAARARFAFFTPITVKPSPMPPKPSRGRTRLLCFRQPPRQRNRVADGSRDARLFCR